MNLKAKYTLILGATLMLSFCNGNQSSVVNPYGQNASKMTVQDYLNTAANSRALPEQQTRNVRYSLNYTAEQADACLKTYADTQQLSNFCNQIMYDRYYRLFGPGFENYIPDNTQIVFGGNGANAGNVVDFDWRGNFANQDYIPQYQAYAGGMDPRGAGYYQTAVPMGSFCRGNTQSITNIQYSNGCGRVNWYWTTIAVDNNNAYNYMNRGYQYYRNGDMNNAQLYMQRAQPVIGPDGSFARRAPNMYGTVLSRRDVGKENAMYKKEMVKSWQNFKQLPKNAGYRLGIRATDMVSSVFERFLTGVEASMSGVSAANYAQAGYNQQVTAYNDMYANAYYDAYRGAQYSTLSAVQADNPCPENKYHYEVGPEQQNTAVYNVITCGN